MSLIEFIHNLVHFSVGHAASLQLAAVVDGLQNNTLEVTIRDGRHLTRSQTPQLNNLVLLEYIIAASCRNN